MTTVVTAAEQAAAAEELGSGPGVVLHLSALDGFVLVAQLQLAVRHPHNDAATGAGAARRLAQRITTALTANRPASARIIEAGWQPDAVLEDWSGEAAALASSAAGWGAFGEVRVPAGGGTDVRVSSHTEAQALAGCIAALLRSEGRARLQAIGAAAVNQAIKGIAIARHMLADERQTELVCTPSFADVAIDGEKRTAIVLCVESRYR